MERAISRGQKRDKKSLKFLTYQKIGDKKISAYDAVYASTRYKCSLISSFNRFANF